MGQVQSKVMLLSSVRCFRLRKFGVLSSLILLIGQQGPEDILCGFGVHDYAPVQQGTLHRRGVFQGLGPSIWHKGRGHNHCVTPISQKKPGCGLFTGVQCLVDI